MEISVRRAKEIKKGGFLSGKGRNIRLTLEIGVALSEEEKALVQKYHDPSISIPADIPRYFESKEAFNIVRDVKGETRISKFHVTARVDNGLAYLENLQTLEKAITTELTNKMNYLKSLDAWEGEDIVSV